MLKKAPNFIFSSVIYYNLSVIFIFQEIHFERILYVHKKQNKLISFSVYRISSQGWKKIIFTRWKVVKLSLSICPEIWLDISNIRRIRAEKFCVCSATYTHTMYKSLGQLKHLVTTPDFGHDTNYHRRTIFDAIKLGRTRTFNGRRNNSGTRRRRKTGEPRNYRWRSVY